jgi:hypothetical protein
VWAGAHSSRPQETKVTQAGNRGIKPMKKIEVLYQKQEFSEAFAVFKSSL